MPGKLILEISELHSFSKADVNAIKKFITCRIDRYRPSYGRVAQDFPRQSVFVGTTNEDEYLRDHTGARRFWPLKTNTILVPKIRDEREQLFAEAVHFYRSGSTWWEMPEEQTLDQQENRRQGDEWEQIVTNYLKIKDESTIEEVAVNCLGIKIERLDMIAQHRIGRILKLLKWRKVHTTRDNTFLNVWRSPNYYYDSPPF